MPLPIDDLSDQCFIQPAMTATLAASPIGRFLVKAKRAPVSY